jgi:hypothetical protein
LRRSVLSRVRAVVFFGVCIALVGSAAFLIFELGRYKAGYSILDQRRSEAGLQQIIAQQEEQADELGRQLTILRTSQDIDEETYTQVETTLSQLQVQIQAQEEELAFYRGIISPEDGNVGLRIQELTFTDAGSAGRFLLRMVLVQAISRDGAVSGTVKVRIEGLRAGAPEVWALDDLLLNSETGGMAYDFRYFQALQREIEFPEDFLPNRVDVEIWPKSSRGPDTLHNYAWATVVR